MELEVPKGLSSVIIHYHGPISFVMGEAKEALLLQMSTNCNITKQFAFVHVGPENITMGCPNLVQERLKLSLNVLFIGAFHGYILRAHMN